MNSIRATATQLGNLVSESERVHIQSAGLVQKSIDLTNEIKRIKLKHKIMAEVFPNSAEMRKEVAADNYVIKLKKEKLMELIDIIGAWNDILTDDSNQLIRVTV